MSSSLKRRDFMKFGVAGAVATAFPSILKAADAPTIKIGILQPVSGPLAMDGEYGRLGAELAIKNINENGGIKSLGGAKLEMVFADARSTPEVAVQEVEVLKSKGVVAIVGGFSSAICLAASQAAYRHNLPYLVDVGVTDQIIERGLSNTFRFSPGFSIVTKSAIDKLVELNNGIGNPVKKIVLVHEDGLFGSGMAKLMAEELPKHNFEILDSISHPTPARDISNVALRIRSLRPDLIIPSSYYAETVLLLRTLAQQRVKLKGIYSVLNGAASNMRFVREFPAAAEFIMDCNHWDDPHKARAAELRAQVRSMNKEWMYNVPLNYSSVLLLADAIENAASVDSDEIIESLKNSTFEDHVMPYGPTQFVNGQNMGAQPVVTQVQDAEVKVISPEQFANAKAVFPING